MDEFHVLGTHGIRPRCTCFLNNKAMLHVLVCSSGSPAKRQAKKEEEQQK